MASRDGLCPLRLPLLHDKQITLHLKDDRFHRWVPVEARPYVLTLEELCHTRHRERRRSATNRRRELRLRSSLTARRLSSGTGT